MIMAIVNSKAADVYNSIKRVTLTELGIPSQVYIFTLLYNVLITSYLLT